MSHSVKRHASIVVGAQIRMARAALKLGVRELAALAHVAPNTITRAEAGQPINAATMKAVTTALETAGVEFISENGGGPGVRLTQSHAR
jgi:transcriptional regulator with XRE-family HTH domain